MYNVPWDIEKYIDHIMLCLNIKTRKLALDWIVGEYKKDIHARSTAYGSRGKQHMMDTIIMLEERLVMLSEYQMKVRKDKITKLLG